MIKLKSSKYPHIECLMRQAAAGSTPLCQLIQDEGNPTIRCTQCGLTYPHPEPVTDVSEGKVI